MRLINYNILLVGLKVWFKEVWNWYNTGIKKHFSHYSSTKMLPLTLKKVLCSKNTQTHNTEQVVNSD